MGNMSEAAKAAKREYSHKYYLEHREHLLEYGKAWKNANPDKVKQYRANVTPEKRREYKRRYWEKKANEE